MLFVIECIFACGIFSFMILPPLYKNPVNQIMSYPKEIRMRVECLPQYKGIIDKIEIRHLSINLIFIFLIAIILAVVAYFSGAKSFTSAFIHVFILFLVVNIYDLLILDIGLFCHSKKTRIPGTEDMDKEYRNPRHHIIGAGTGTNIGAGVALLSGGIIHVVSIYLLV